MRALFFPRALGVLAAAAMVLTPSPVAALTVRFLEAPLLLDPPLAHPRSPQTGIVSLSSPQAPEKVALYRGILGRRLQLVTVSGDEVIMQVGVDAGAWADLQHEEQDRFSLVTIDFLLGLPVMLTWNNFAAEVGFNHISGHLGDGEVGRTPFSYSRDFLTARLSHVWKKDDASLNVYGGGGYIHKIFPEDLGRGFWGGGAEVILTLRPRLKPYLAADVTYNQDVGSIDRAAELGVFINGHDAPARMRLAATVYLGSDRRGQFVGEERREVGLGLFIRP